MLDLKNRYDKTYFYKNIEFYLSDYIPNNEECRIIILKIVEQASRDYLSLRNAKTLTLQYTWEIAREFIFNKAYLIDWGDRKISPAHLLDLIDMDIEWLRRKMKEKFKQLENENNG
jgi:hypothetical protein